MIYKENSDITLVKEGIIAHGVNCQGAIGRGVARAICEKWPEVKRKYQVDFMNCSRPRLSEVKVVYIDKGLTLVNCYTQNRYGRDGKVYASLYAVLMTMKIIVTRMNAKQINIPKIGCGLGGLEWKDVEYGLLNLEKLHKVEFIVHTF